jgi:HTH-type transcriptional regulator/antitoxin HigA
MSGKRELSMTMVKRLRERFHVPADLLILASESVAA